MRQLMAGLVIMALAVTGCAASATTGSGKPAAVTSHAAAPAASTTSASGTSSAPPGLGGLANANPGPAQWVVDGTLETAGVPAQPLPGVVTFRDSANGHSVQVTVGASGKFSLGLVAGTYTATGQAGHSGSACAAPVTFTVQAGQLTRVSLVCQASA
jgi:hypothetical protein